MLSVIQSPLSWTSFLTRCLSVIAFVLLFINLYVVIRTFVYGNEPSYAWRFYFDKRGNVPYFFSLMLLILWLGLLIFVANARRFIHERGVWRPALVMFLIFILDEAFDLHYRFKMRTYGTIASYDPAALSHYLWTIPYFLIFGFLLFSIARNGSKLPGNLRRMLVIGFVVFLAGVVIMEFTGTYYYVRTRNTDLTLLLIKTLEETFQMAGLIIFISALVSHVKPTPKIMIKEQKMSNY